MTPKQEEICFLFKHTTHTTAVIAKIVGVKQSYISITAKKFFSADFRMNRKKLNYSKSKLGSNNPMTGKCGAAHHNFIGAVSDNRGYLMVLKPEWYTGRKNSKHVFEHSVNYCLANGTTEIPKGYCVHHKDQDKLNNDPDNLLMMSLSDHMKLHTRLRHAETIRKE